jgi:hypothetical protein
MCPGVALVGEGQPMVLTLLCLVWCSWEVLPLLWQILVLAVLLHFDCCHGLGCSQDILRVCLLVNWLFP